MTDNQINVTMEDSKLRRSQRKRKQPEKFIIIQDSVKPHNVCRKKRKKTIEKTPAEEASEHASKPLQEMILTTINSLNLPLKRIDVRSRALHQTIRQALIMVNNDHVTSTKNGEYLVTSSDRTKTYQVRSTSLANKLHFACDCGQQFKQGDRITCKHVFAVVLNNLNSLISLFFQVPPGQIIHNIKDICKLMNNIDMSEKQEVIKPVKKKSNTSSKKRRIDSDVESDEQSDYFSQILLSSR